MSQETLLWLNRINDFTETPKGHVCEKKNLWNAWIRMITKRSVSNSERGSIWDIKTLAEVSKYGRCYTTTSIRSTNSLKTSRRPISGNKCSTSVVKWCQRTGFGTQSKNRNMKLETNCLQETQSCRPVCQNTRSLPSPHVCAETRSITLEFEISTMEWGQWVNVIFIYDVISWFFPI